MGRSAIYLVIGILVIAALLLLDAYAPRAWQFGGYPRSLEISIREPILAAVERLTFNPTVIVVTQGIRTSAHLFFLRPQGQLLTQTPWW